ncbi:DNA (cytosine-5)-methyltransferase 3 like [Paralvinella palmiformis]|uniref:DNA (Cytosine-5)-methyltransferase 3 like n=1 Tax=Paralvinella palmiformis TaxID=53620 RepID=A0AAD9JMC4_9ANNE|nr:DNA (cytosine-5)-methyltransferase 3 like [Paralvinella palmiformis]
MKRQRRTIKQMDETPEKIVPPAIGVVDELKTDYGDDRNLVTCYIPGEVDLIYQEGENRIGKNGVVSGMGQERNGSRAEWVKSGMGRERNGSRAEWVESGMGQERNGSRAEWVKSGMGRERNGSRAEWVESGMGRERNGSERNGSRAEWVESGMGRRKHSQADVRTQVLENNKNLSQASAPKPKPPSQGSKQTTVPAIPGEGGSDPRGPLLNHMCPYKPFPQGDLSRLFGGQSCPLYLLAFERENCPGLQSEQFQEANQCPLNGREPRCTMPAPRATKDQPKSRDAHSLAGLVRSPSCDRLPTPER